MLDPIFDLVVDIKRKVSLVKMQLEKERSDAKLLVNEIKDLRSQLAKKEVEMNNFSTKISGLETKLIMKEDQDISVIEETSISENQIDELVKEIEYCIIELKK